MVVILQLVTNGQNDDALRSGLDLVQRNVTRAAKRDDEFASQGTAARLSEAEGRNDEMAQDRVLYRIDRALSQLEILDAARSFEQEVEEPLEVVACAVGEANLERTAEAHLRSCLRL